MKLFQIEEPEGGPAGADAPGAAIGIDASGAAAEIAFAVGGNAVVLDDREGYRQALPAPGAGAPVEAWRALFEGARLRAERALARPVTHAVILLGAAADADAEARLREAALAAGLVILRIARRPELPAGMAGAPGAAILAEDLAPPASIADFR